MNLQNNNNSQPHGPNIVHLVTYADDSNNRKNGAYVKTQAQMNLFCKEYFSEIIFFHNFNKDTLLNSELYKNNLDLFHPRYYISRRKGRQLGRYVYKMNVILETLKNNVNYGEYVLWHDSSPFKHWYDKRYKKKYNLDKHIEICNQNKGITCWTNNKRHKLSHLCSPKMMDNLNGLHLKNTKSCCTSWMIIKKTDHTLKILNEAVDYMKGDFYKELHLSSNYDDGDQDVMDIILKKNNMDNHFIGKDKCILSSFYT